MTRWGALSAVLVALALPLDGEAAAQATPVRVRVLTYNIHHGEGRDRRVDLSRIAEVIRGADADVIALQEVDRGTTRTGGVDQLGELSALLGMHGEFGRAMDYEGGEYGVAVLSRWPIVDAETRALPFAPDHEPRAALTVRVRAGAGGPVLRITSTHLDNTRESEVRPAQAARLNELLALDDGEPGVLAGDFNARVGTEVMRMLEERWGNALPDQPAPGDSVPTAPPAAGPGQGRAQGGRGRGPRGDFVLFRPAAGWRVLEARSLDDQGASDHRPVLAVLEWTGAAGR